MERNSGDVIVIPGDAAVGIPIVRRELHSRIIRFYFETVYMVSLC